MMMEAILCVFTVCLIYLMFSEGIEKGAMILLTLISFIGIPIYFILSLDSLLAGVMGLIVGFVIYCTIGGVLDKMNVDSN